MVMVVAVGIYLIRFNRRTEDYFKGGGHLPWGMSGLSLFISGFSAFMFVSAAGFTYRNGGAALVLFPLAGICYLFGYYLYGPLWRRSRIDTPMQFLGRRYSPGTTYFYTLLTVIPNVLILGIYIYTLCIFISTAFGFNTMTFDLGVTTVSGFQLSMIGVGVVMVIYTALGGLWAVIVTDTLQFVILFLVSLIMLPVAYHFLGDGSITDGVTRLVEEAPEGYFSLSIQGEAPIFYLAYFINIVLGYNVNWHIAQRYYSVADERDTKKMALLCAVLSLVLPLLWITPVLATKVLFPGLESMWPELTEPSEAAFVTLAMSVLPHGMLGIMAAAIFAATMSSADTIFNWLGAVLTEDVYVPISKRLHGEAPPERRQLTVGKATVLTLGLVAIGVALTAEQYGGAFDVYLKVNSLYSAPMFIPVMLGLVYTRTPWWSGMASFGVGALAVVVGSAVANLVVGLPIGSFDVLFGDLHIAPFGIEMGRYELNTFLGTLASTLCFFGTALVNRREGAFARQIMHLEDDLNTPAHAEGARLDLRGLQAYVLAGRVVMVLGALLVVLTWFGSSSRVMLNLVAGGMALAIGIGIEMAVRHYRQRLKATREEVIT